MNKQNKVFEPFIIVLFTVIGLLVLSQFDTAFTVGPFKLKRISLVSEILEEKEMPLVKAEKIRNPDTDSLHRDVLPPILKKTTKNQGSPGIIQFHENDTSGGLTHFFEALDATLRNGKKTRIAYFGDSMIESDMISQEFRNLLQKKMGGNGVGFVPVTSITADVRKTINHEFSDNWQKYHLMHAVSPQHSLGISGYVFEPAYFNRPSDQTEDDGSWVKYGTVAKAGLDKFHHIKLYYGNNTGENYVYFQQKSAKLSGSKPVNELVLNKDSAIQQILINFECQSAVNVYGFSFENDSGVYVDNYSFRGNSGLALSKIPYPVLAGLNEYLDYNLIILQYGMNVIRAEVTDFSWYERGMVNVIKYLQRCFPKSSFLLISTGDKSYRTDGKYITDPSVPLVVEVQKKVAEKTGIAFWNLYEFMGGYNSMVKWVEGDTVLAAKDYTHLNNRGANKIGALLYKHLMKNYEVYSRNKTKKT